MSSSKLSLPNIYAKCLKGTMTIMLATFAQHGLTHGLMVDPPARNAICGLAADQQPHNATDPACIDAFANDRDGGYQFMSVLTHDIGRKGVQPLPKNVCGFDSETWDNLDNVTPWDTATNWPTTAISSGPLDIKWNISWGPHFDDSEEFVYYITKPDFIFQVGVPLTWDDFEQTPFCDLGYDDKAPTANPNVVSDVAGATFVTRCNVPARTGRHVIYGEWGRNFFTFERFHGCLDVTFDGSSNPAPVVPDPVEPAPVDPVPANIAPTANAQSVSLTQDEPAPLTLSGSDSDGTIASYDIALQPSYGSLTGNGANRVYTPDAGYTGSDSLSFTVTDNDGAVSTPAVVSIQVNAVPVTAPSDNIVPSAGFSITADELTVSVDGSSSYDGDASPNALTYAWDFGDGAQASGVSVVHEYSNEGTYSVLLTVSDGEDTASNVQAVTVVQSVPAEPVAPATPAGPSVACDYIVANSWNNGFVAEIRLTNNSSESVFGWDVSWEYTDSTEITNSWSTTLTGTGPYFARNLGWNYTIEPGQTVSFGVQGTHNGSTQVPTLTGDVCE